PASSQSPKLYVRNGVNGKDRLLIDPETLSNDPRTHLSIHGYRPSPDGRYVAYTTAAGGSEEPVLHILDTLTGKELPETADRVYLDPAFWRPGSRSFFYTRGQQLAKDMPASAKLQNMRVYLHVLGHPFDDDPAVLGRGLSDAAIALAAVEFPEVVTAPGSQYAIAMLSPGTDERLRIYAAPVASIKDSKTAWRAIAARYGDEYIGGDNSDIPVIALRGDTLY